MNDRRPFDAASPPDNEILLRPVAESDLPALLEIINSPEVSARWGSGAYNMEMLRDEFLEDNEIEALTIEVDGEVAGSIQYNQELEPDYKHASIDVFIGPRWHGRGIGTYAVGSIVRHLIDDLGHHRITIDPAADNAAAIACYKKAGFKPVGILRQYERGPNGKFHDGLLMDLLAQELP